MFCCHAQRLPSPLQTAMPFTDWHFKIIYKNIDHSRTSQTASFLPSCHSTRQGCSAHGSKGQNPVMPSLSHPSDPSNDGMPWDAASPTSEKRSALSEFIAINSPNFIHKYPHYSKHLETKHCGVLCKIHQNTLQNVRNKSTPEEGWNSGFHWKQFVPKRRGCGEPRKHPRNCT